jgi:hypothetical protein
VITLNELSSVTLDSFKETNPCVVSLNNGSLRSKINQDYTKFTASNEKIKFIVKAGTAIMGVRGTDFTAIYNPEKNISTLITFEGSVAFAKSNGLTELPHLLTALNSQNVQTVTANNFSTLTSNQSHPTAPAAISKTQFEAIKNADPVTTKNTPSRSPNSTNPIIPPGVDAKTFSDSNKQPLSTSEAPTPPASFSQNPSNNLSSQAPPEGRIDPKTLTVTPAAGGFINLKSGEYITPPANSTFDAKAQAYTPPANMGTVNAQTGEFTPNPSMPAPSSLTMSNLPSVTPAAPTIAPAIQPPTASAATPTQNVTGMNPAVTGSQPAAPTITPPAPSGIAPIIPTAVVMPNVTTPTMPNIPALPPVNPPLPPVLPPPPVVPVIPTTLPPINKPVPPIAPPPSTLPGNAPPPNIPPAITPPAAPAGTTINITLPSQQAIPGNLGNTSIQLPKTPSTVITPQTTINILPGTTP